MMYHMKDHSFILYCKDSILTTKYLRNCLSRTFIMHAGEVAVVVLVPLTKLAAHTRIKRWKIFHTSIWSKVILGLVLLLLYETSLLAVEVSGILVTHHNFSCLLATGYEDMFNGRVLNLSYTWLLMPQVLSGLVDYILFQNGLALICSQAPRPMQGLLIGVIFYACSAPLLLSKLLYSFIKKFFNKSQKYCGFSFFLGTMITTMVFIVMVILIKKCYVFRRRDENVHNEHIFAVEYYDKYLPSKAVLNK